MLITIVGVAVATDSVYPDVNTVVGNGPVASHVSDVAPAVSCAIEYVDAVEIVAPENVNDAVVTAGITNTFCAPRNELLITDTDRIEIPVAIDTLAVVPSVGTEIDVLEPSEIDTVDTAPAALMNSLVVVTVSPLPRIVNAPLCAAVIDTVVCPIVVDDVPTSVTLPAPPPYFRFMPGVLSVVETMLIVVAPLTMPPMVMEWAPEFTVPHDDKMMEFVPSASPVSTFDPDADIVDDAKEMDSPETVAVVTKFDPLDAVSTDDPTAVSPSPMRLVACTLKLDPAATVLVVVTSTLSVFTLPTEMPTFVAVASMRDDAPEIVMPMPLTAPAAALSATFVPAVVSSAALYTEIVTRLIDALELKKLPLDAVTVALVPATPVPATLSTYVFTDAPTALTVHPPAAVTAVDASCATTVTVAAAPFSTKFEPAVDTIEPAWNRKLVVLVPVR